MCHCELQPLLSVSHNFRFGPVLPCHLDGPAPYVTVYDGSRRLSIFGVAGQLRTPPPHAPEVLTRPDKAGQWVAHPQDSYSATPTSCDFPPQNEPPRQRIYYFRVTFREGQSPYAPWPIRIAAATAVGGLDHAPAGSVTHSHRYYVSKTIARA